MCLEVTGRRSSGEGWSIRAGLAFLAGLSGLLIQRRPRTDPRSRRTRWCSLRLPDASTADETPGCHGLPPPQLRLQTHAQDGWRRTRGHGSSAPAPYLVGPPHQAATCAPHFSESCSARQSEEGGREAQSLTPRKEPRCLRFCAGPVPLSGCALVSPPPHQEPAQALHQRDTGDRLSGAHVGAHSMPPSTGHPGSGH